MTDALWFALSEVLLPLALGVVLGLVVGAIIFGPVLAYSYRNHRKFMESK